MENIEKVGLGNDEFGWGESGEVFGEGSWAGKHTTSLGRGCKADVTWGVWKNSMWEGRIDPVFWSSEIAV